MESIFEKFGYTVFGALLSWLVFFLRHRFKLREQWRQRAACLKDRLAHHINLVFLLGAKSVLIDKTPTSQLKRIINTLRQDAALCSDAIREAQQVYRGELLRKMQILQTSLQLFYDKIEDYIASDDRDLLESAFVYDPHILAIQSYEICLFLLSSVLDHNEDEINYFHERLRWHKRTLEELKDMEKKLKKEEKRKQPNYSNYSNY